MSDEFMHDDFEVLAAILDKIDAHVVTLTSRVVSIVKYVGGAN